MCRERFAASCKSCCQYRMAPRRHVSRHRISDSLPPRPSQPPGSKRAEQSWTKGTKKMPLNAGCGCATYGRATFRQSTTAKSALKYWRGCSVCLCPPSEFGDLTPARKRANPVKKKRKDIHGGIYFPQFNRDLEPPFDDATHAQRPQGLAVQDREGLSWRELSDVFKALDLHNTGRIEIRQFLDFVYNAPKKRSSALPPRPRSGVFVWVWEGVVGWGGWGGAEALSRVLSRCVHICSCCHGTLHHVTSLVTWLY